MKKNYVYRLDYIGEFFSSRTKAHARLCNQLRINEEDFVPYMEKIIPGGKVFYYNHNGDVFTITKKLIQ